MKLILSLSVLAVALLMVLEGPAPAQADSGITEDQKELGSVVKETVQKAFEPWTWMLNKFVQAKESIERIFS